MWQEANEKNPIEMDLDDSRYRFLGAEHKMSYINKNDLLFFFCLY